MNKYDGLARIILQNVGGKSNIESVTHCITRLRFKLKDEALTKTEILKRTDGIINILKSGGLYQVVIGSTVEDVYDALLEVGHLEEKSEISSSNAKEKKSIFASFISVVTAVFIPLLGMLCATGVIKGVLTLLTFYKVMDPLSGTYLILYNGADALFYFMPVIIGYTAAKKFGLNDITGIMLGLTMCVPAIVGIAPNAIAVAAGVAPAPLGTILGMNYYTKMFGIPIIMPSSGNYTSSVIPILLVIWFASILEKKLKKVMPSSIKNFMVPLCVLLITIPLMFILIGPIAAILTDIIGVVVKFLFGSAPIVGGIVVGGLWQILVIFGLHWSLIPLMFINLASMKFDMFLTPYFAASFAQMAALIAVMIKTKDKQTKAIGVPAVISAVFGITEPSLYGVTLPRKTPFFYSCIGGAVGGAIISATKAYTYISGGIGIFGFPSFIMTQEYADMYNVPLSMSGVLWAAIAVVVAMIVTFALTILFYKEPDTGTFTSSGKKKANAIEEILSPVCGKIINLSEVKDEAFSSGTLGKGCAIEPSKGEVRAPFDGIVSVLPDTCHAIGLTSDSGLELLVHVGMNTVELKGNGFNANVKEGDRVKKGDLLITFDLDRILKAGYSLVTPVIVSNTESYNSVSLNVEKNSVVNVGASLLTASV